MDKCAHSDSTPLLSSPVTVSGKSMTMKWDEYRFCRACHDVYVVNYARDIEKISEAYVVVP